MKSANICSALAVLTFCISGQAISQPKRSEIDSANRLFQVGKFAEAGKLYSRMADENPKNYSVALEVGRIALLANRLDDAQKWLERAAALEPGVPDAKVMLAEAFYRRDDYQNAAASLRGVESSNRLLTSQYPTLDVAQLESFKGQTPYEIQGNGLSTRLKFLKTDPLPLVSVRVNGGDKVTFFIDTGASEVLLDTDFARELGIPKFGSVQGTFSGGRRADVQSGRIDSLTVGDWTVKNVPVAVMALRQLSKDLGIERIDGCIGTNVLYHFLATLDYPHGELVLRQKTATGLEQFRAASSGRGAEVPFWIAGDHFMVGWGRVETIPPVLLFVDTGLAGAGVKLAEPVLKEAQIKLQQDKAFEGAGGGGKLKIVPYTVRRISLGDITANNVPGLYDGPFPWENTFGFHLAGMVGHDFFRPYAVTFDFEGMRIFLQ